MGAIFSITNSGSDVNSSLDKRRYYENLIAIEKYKSSGDNFTFIVALLLMKNMWIKRIMGIVFLNKIFEMYVSNKKIARAKQMLLQIKQDEAGDNRTQNQLDFILNNRESIKIKHTSEKYRLFLSNPDREIGPYFINVEDAKKFRQYIYQKVGTDIQTIENCYYISGTFRGYYQNWVYISDDDDESASIYGNNPPIVEMMEEEMDNKSSDDIDLPSLEEVDHEFTSSDSNSE